MILHLILLYRIYMHYLKDPQLWKIVVYSVEMGNARFISSTVGPIEKADH